MTWELSSLVPPRHLRFEFVQNSSPSIFRLFPKGAAPNNFSRQDAGRGLVLDAAMHFSLGVEMWRKRRRVAAKADGRGVARGLAGRTAACVRLFFS
jgi:hypothetical protein